MYLEPGAAGHLYALPCACAHCFLGMQQSRIDRVVI